MTAQYDNWLVLLSIAIAWLASYAALSLAGRARGDGHRYWLASGALVMSLGIWSMHFIGMLAFKLPISVGYDPWLTLISGLLAVLASMLALKVVSVSKPGWKRFGFGGLVMGSGVAMMHYTGMAAMRMQPAIHYTPPAFTASLLIAMLAATIALLLVFDVSQARQRRSIPRKLMAASVMAAGISGMHYTGMHAAQLAPDARCIEAAGGLGSDVLAAVITLGVVLVLLLTAITLHFDTQIRRQDRHYHGLLDEAKAQLQDLEIRDPLTGLYNRSRFESELRDLRESDTRSRALMLIDLDGFSEIATVIGLEASDRALIHVARRLQQLVGDQGRVGRIAADKFLLLTPPLAIVGDLPSFADKLLMRVREAMRVDHHEVELTASIGAVLLPADGPEELLIAMASLALVQAQRGGRNTMRLYRDEFGKPNSELMHLLRDLRMAIRSGDGQLFLVYQPKVDAATGRIAGAEALLRWNHPTLGLVLPSQFIEQAERFGLIDILGVWTVSTACHQARIWKQAGIRVPISVNLSPEQLRWPGLVQAITDAMARCELESGDLCLELTESAVMDQGVDARSAIDRLSAAGIRLSIDDFGTGYSSLSRLRELPVGEIKLDRSFIVGVQYDGPAAAIVRALVQLAHSLSLKLVAEGVETSEQASILRTLGCDELQGFFFSPGVRGAEFERLVAQLGTGARTPTLTYTHTKEIYSVGRL